MRLLIDENVRRDVVVSLKSLGHDVMTVVPGSDDEHIARIAQETKRIIVTHDQHFADILSFPPNKYSGIIRIRINPPSAPTIIAALNDLFQKLSPDRIDKRLIIVERDGFRIR